MTHLEALTRVETLWGEANVTVAPCPGFPDEWLIETGGRPHIMDSAGRPTCHRSCIIRAEEMQHG